MKETEPDQALPVACALIASAGFLDAFAWLLHGHVFTNAHTGNIVLLGTFLSQGDWQQAVRHLPPLLAFVPGVFAAQWFRSRRLGGARSAAVILGFEIVLLSALGVLAGFLPSAVVTAGLSFTMALQNSAFERVGRWSFTSVVTTGNLRTFFEGMSKSLAAPGDPEANSKTAALGAVCAAFAAGALVGAQVTTWLGGAAMVVPVGMLTAALWSTLMRGKRPA